jgi:hypothetical protein
MLSFRMFGSHQPYPLRSCPSATFLQICFPEKTVASPSLQPQQQNHHLHTLLQETAIPHSQGFCFLSLAHSFALFCRPRFCNSFPTNQLRTLAKKHPGVGVPPHRSQKATRCLEAKPPSCVGNFQLRRKHHPPVHRIHDRVHNRSVHSIATAKRFERRLVCGQRNFNRQFVGKGIPAKFHSR